MADPDPPPLEGLVGCPEIYADGMAGAMISGGVIKVVLFTQVPDPALAYPRRVAAARLAIPASHLGEIHRAIGEVLAQVERDGHLPGAAPASKGH